MPFTLTTGLASRRRRPEIMDRPDLDPEEHAAALRGLHRINRMSRCSAVLWRKIERLARDHGRRGSPLRLLDVASGGGDIAIDLARRAARAGLEVRLAGCDISPRAVSLATRRAAAEAVDVAFFTHDALAGDMPRDYDVLTSTLFLHHLETREAVGLLRRMSEAARRSILVDDLIRSRLGFALAWAGCRLLTRSRVARHDGPISVGAAFRLDEARALAREAGLETATLETHCPQRFLLSWSRP